MIGVLLALTGFLFQSPASSLKVTPAIVSQIDISKLHGQVRQLAWAPDGKELYLQTYDTDKDGSLKTKYHYTLALGGGDPKPLDDQPAWAADYLSWSTGKTAPDDPTMTITLDPPTTRTISAASAPMAGDYAKGGNPGANAGTLVDSVVAAKQASQTLGVITIRLKNEIVGEFVNSLFVPGLTFGWGPKGSDLIAFSEKETGRLFIMDKQGTKLKVDGTKNVVVPAWAQDGTKLAYLQGQGKNKYALVVASVGR